jgi:hypothetical protein
MKPKVYRWKKLFPDDPDLWVAEYGEVCGRGKSPAEACADFDRKWVETL